MSSLWFLWIDWTIKGKNIIREKGVKIKINCKECGKNLNMNEMEEVSEEALKILKKGINLDSEDY